MSVNKLELNWVGKENIVRVEPRILIEDLSNSYGSQPSENMLIHGDNLLALKALEQDFLGRIKCIYIDPPYNTGSAFEHYDDNLEHSTWLSLMKPRLEILKNLLSEDGSIWISIDDDEGHYLKVFCDEIFGRSNFVNTVIWEKKYAPQNDAKWLSDSHDFILVYAKNKNIWRPNLLPRTEEMNDRYKNPDNDPRGVWKSSDLSVKTYTESCDYPIETPSGRVVNPPAGRCWRTTKERFEQLKEENRIWFGPNGDNTPSIKRFLTDVKNGLTALTIWKYTEVGHNQDARKEVKAFNSVSVFATPKPERLIQRIIHLASNKDDIVLDSFLGSGTTTAVAHKMGRKWIGIEMGDHMFTHSIVRMRQVVLGESGGISKSVNWRGGGGFKFFELAPSLISVDQFGNEILNREYSIEMLARAMAKHENFIYSGNSTEFWKQAKGSENSYLFTTLMHVSFDFVNSIFLEMKSDEFLVIACKSFDSSIANRFRNIKVKKIPNSILNDFDYGIDNYNLAGDGINKDGLDGTND